MGLVVEFVHQLAELGKGVRTNIRNLVVEMDIARLEDETKPAVLRFGE